MVHDFSVVPVGRVELRSNIVRKTIEAASVTDDILLK